MAQPDYDYYGLLASTWDVWRDNTANWSDRNLYLDIIRQYGQPVLDIGCGTGRLILDYLSLGIDIDGVDNSPEMLEICQTKGRQRQLTPTLYQQQMQSLQLPRRYRTILAPSSAVQLLTDPAVALEAIRRFLSHLEPGGAFIGSFAFECRPGDPLDTGWELLFEKPRPEDGAMVRSWTREWRDREQQLWHSEQRFEVQRDGQIIETDHQRRSPEGRWYSQAQATQLLREAGFIDIQLLHDFTHEPARPDDRLFCALGFKPR